MRKHYLDNIRWATVLLVVVYHVFYMFNHIGVLGGVGPLGESMYPDIIMYVVYPWFMVLMFLIAGISSRYSLSKRTHKEFLKERAVKFIAPTTLGLFVLHWISGYINLKIGGATELMPSFLIYPISVFAGQGPLWFIQLLLIFSLLLVLIRKIDKNDKFYNLCKKCNTPIILLFGILLWGASQILNMPVMTVYRFGIYFTAFLLGYFVFSHDEVMEKVIRMRIPMLCLALVGSVGYTIFYFGQNCCDNPVLKTFFTNAYMWVCVLAILGCFAKYFDKTNKVATYLSKSSYGIYIVHYPALLVPAYLFYTYTNLPAGVIYLFVSVIGFVGTFLLYEGIRRVPVLRFMILGIKGKKKEKA